MISVANNTQLIWHSGFHVVFAKSISKKGIVIPSVDLLLIQVTVIPAEQNLPCFLLHPNLSFSAESRQWQEQFSLHALEFCAALPGRRAFWRMSQGYLQLDGDIQLSTLVASLHYLGCRTRK